MMKRTVPLFILLLAFFLQMMYLAELRQAFPSGFNQPFCGIDAVAHANRADGLLDGSILTEGPHRHFYFIPLYPFYLAALKMFWGDSVLFPIFLQALLQLAGMAALYSIGRMAFSSLAGALAALGMATYSYYLYYLPCFDQALLSTPLFTLAIFFILKYHHTRKSGFLVGGGIMLAGAILSRPTFLLIAPVVLIWLLGQRVDAKLGDWRLLSSKPLTLLPRATPHLPISPSPHLLPFLKEIFLLTLPIIILIAPITWHNYRVTGRFILISDNFGVNLFTGNNPDATGLDTLAHVQGQPAELRFREFVKREERGETTLAREALRYMLSQPVDWLALMATKTWLWFGEEDERLVTPVFPLMVQQSQILVWLPLEWQALALVALLGLLLVRGRSRSQTVFLWLVYGVFSAATILFFIQLRFRLPLVPFVLLLAALLLAAAPGWRHESPPKFWAVLAILLAMLPLLPGLWIFIALFAGLGLWFHNRPGGKSRIQNTQRILRLKSKITITLAVGLYLLAVGWWVKADALAAATSQEIDHYLGPPLAGPAILGQSFQMECDGLNRIEVTLGLLSDRHDRPVTFYLATDSSGQELIYSETFNAAAVSDYQRKIFTFPPIADSAGRTFFFFLSSPTSKPENALTVRGYADTPVDRYPEGSAFAGQLGALHRFEADFAFVAYCDQSVWEKLWAVLRRLL